VGLIPGVERAPQVEKESPLVDGVLTGAAHQDHIVCKKNEEKVIYTRDVILEGRKCQSCY
jgi:hypothetical protein